MTLLLVIYSLAANAPTSLTASIISSTSISVSWTAPVGGANGYIIRFGDSSTIDVSSTETVVLSGLTAGEAYLIRVYGFIDVPSVASSPMTIQLLGKYIVQYQLLLLLF